jgi:hypothetical protein
MEEVEVVRALTVASSDSSVAVVSEVEDEPSYNSENASFFDK